MTTVIGSRMVNGYSTGSGVKYHSVGAGPPLHITIGTGHLITGEGRKRKVGRPKKKNAVAYKKRHAKEK